MSDDGYIPLKSRFKAWWNGSPSAAGMAVSFNTSADPQEAGENITIDEKIDGLEWTKGRIDAVQMVWGNGQVHPGGDAYLTRMMKRARIDPDTMILDLTSGLGAAARLLPDMKDCNVRSMEADEKLASAGFSRFGTEIELYDPVAGGLSRKDWGTFAAIISRDLMHTLDKPKTLNDLAAMLFPEAVLVVSDFVIDPAKSDHPAMCNWLQREPIVSDFWTVEEYRDGIDTARLDIEMLADETEVMSKIIKTAWNNCWNNLASEKMTRGIVDALAYEAEIWMHRLAALESGGLRYILAHGKSREKKIRKLTN